MFQMIRNFINGLAFGVSLIIPGVSGGTLAIILGFYDQIIEVVNHFTKDVRRYIKFLLPFVMGIAVGIVAFASLIQFLLEYYSFPAMMFFIGLIAGIIPNMYRQAKKNTGGGSHKLIDLTLVVVPIGLLVLTAQLNDGMATINPAEAVMDLSLMLFIFIIGVIAAASLLIPGLSGSFVLLIAGIYSLATYSVSSIRLLLTDITNMELILSIVSVLGPLGLGVIIGILLMARLIERLLKRRTRAVFFVITGLMIGSVYALAVDPILLQSGVSVPVAIAGLVSCVVGVVISYKMGKKGMSR